jgi:predicted metal-dependent hydrolase
MAQRSSVSVEPPRFDRPEVEVRASAKRKKTGTAHWSGSRIVVQIPARLRGKERSRFVDELVERLLTQRPQNAAGDASLEERSRVLAELYLGGVQPASVRWVANQRRRWASCSPASREIRVSSRLRQCPEWVIDAVLVHELAHLLEADHSAAFYELANRHPRQHECEMFLDGFALGLGLRIEDADVLGEDEPASDAASKDDERRRA